MSDFLGFYNTSGTRTHVRFQFTTHDAAGANVAPSTAFEAADLRIYRAADGAAYSATQRSSAAGITMTSPFDTLTGVHDVDIDLRDNTDAGFYASGYRYAVILAPDETIDGQTITGVVLREFEIGPQPVNVTHVAGTAQTARDLGGQLDVAVSTRLASASYTAPPSAASIRAEMDANSTDLDAIGVLATAIKTKTDQLAFTVANQVDANALALNGSAAAASKMERLARSIVTGTCTTGGTATSVVASAIAPASSADGQFIGLVMKFDDTTTTAALRGQATTISGYTHATKTFAVAALTTAPASGDTFTVS